MAGMPPRDDARPVDAGITGGEGPGHAGNRRLHQRSQTFLARQKKP